MSEEKVKTVSIRARGNTTRNEPFYPCANCGCKRYNPCNCKKKAENQPSRRNKK